MELYMITKADRSCVLVWAWSLAEAMEAAYDCIDDLPKMRMQPGFANAFQEVLV